jgi:acylphosphatase
MADRLHVLIEGDVQGVGFRFAAQREAVGLGLNGWVRNLPDGRVEAEFEGPRDALEEMRGWCDRGPRAARVDRVTEAWSSGAPRYTSFRIAG